MCLCAFALCVFVFVCVCVKEEQSPALTIEDVRLLVSFVASALLRLYASFCFFLFVFFSFCG